MKLRGSIILLFFSSLFLSNTALATDNTEASATPENETLLATQSEEEATSDQEGESVTVEEEAEEEESGSILGPVSVNASVTNIVSMGTLFRDQYTVTNYDLLSFGMGASYSSPVEGLGFSLGMGFSKYLTEAGGSIYQREARFGDMSAGMSYGPIFSTERGLSMSGSMGWTIPTSRASRFEGLRTGVSTGLSFSRSFGSLSLSYSFGFYKNFHRATSITVDCSDIEQGCLVSNDSGETKGSDEVVLDIIAREGGTENIDSDTIALDTGVLGSFGFSNSFSMGYSWFPGFSTRISLGLSDNFTYDNGTITTRDEYTSPNAITGRGHSQGMSGSLSASYAFLDHFSLSLGFSTGQSPLTSDNRRLRFPFWDLETGNMSRTSTSLTLAGSY